MGAHDRTGPRERLVDVGVESLRDDELVALLLGTGTVAESVGIVALRLLEEHGALEGLARAGVGEISQRRGVGWAKAARVAAAVELGRRVSTATRLREPARFPEPSAVVAWADRHLTSLDHEELWILALDAGNGLRAARRVAAGGIQGMFVSPRDPLRVALREGASAFILVHNHPSGDPTPSLEDLEFTRKMARAADVVGTPLVDHVIVGRGASLSMLEHGCLPEWEEAANERAEGRVRAARQRAARAAADSNPPPPRSAHAGLRTR
jgi:DNA repair protein RadC